jgi:hypothetical protein
MEEVEEEEEGEEEVGLELEGEPRKQTTKNPKPRLQKISIDPTSLFSFR